jgi:hypothetical protein
MSKAEDFDYVEIFIIDTTKSRAHFEMLESIEAFNRMNQQTNSDTQHLKRLKKAIKKGVKKARKKINKKLNQTPTK